MKKIIFGFFILCFLQINSQNNIQTVLNAMNEQEKSWNDGNIDNFMKYYWQHDSLRFIGKKGITYGWQNTLNNYKKSYPNKKSMGLLHFTVEYTEQLSPSTIYIIGKWELEKEERVGGYFTLLWKKINGNWLIVADHTS